MQRIDASRTQIAAGAVGVALLVGMLAGCSPTLPTAAATPGSPASAAPSGASPTPSPSATANALPVNALFQIEGVIADRNGARATVVETYFSPVAPDPANSALLTTRCDTADAATMGVPKWTKRNPSPLFITTTITITPVVGTPAWPSADFFVQNMGGDDAVAFGPPTKPFESDCGLVLAQPSTEVVIVTGVLAVPVADPAFAAATSTTDDGWAAEYASYGFQGRDNLTSPPTDMPQNVKALDCSIRLSSQAVATSPKVAEWASFAPTDGCEWSIQ